MGSACSRTGLCSLTGYTNVTPNGELPAPTEAEISEPELLYKQIVEEATSTTDVPKDTWGAAMFLMVTDIPLIRSGEYKVENLYRFALVSVCFVLNIGLQFAVVGWIMKMVTLPGVREAQDIYKTFHWDAFSMGIFNHTKFHALGEMRRDICEISLNQPAFVGSILFLWASQCMQEIRLVQRLFRQISSLPQLPRGVSDKKMVSIVLHRHHKYSLFEEKKIILCCLNGLTHFMLIVLIFIPKFLIVLLLCVLGSAWLVASADYASLILNALALGFVTNIDEMIFVSFLPPRLHKNLDSLKIAIPEKNNMTPEEKESHDILQAYLRSTIFLVAVSVYVVVFIVYQPVLPHFAWDAADVCYSYQKTINWPWCWGKTDCFPFGAPPAGVI